VIRSMKTERKRLNACFSRKPHDESAATRPGEPPMPIRDVLAGKYSIESFGLQTPPRVDPSGFSHRFADPLDRLTLRPLIPALERLIVKTKSLKRELRALPHPRIEFITELGIVSAKRFHPFNAISRRRPKARIEKPERGKVLET
jgi:hypothetical protein